MASKLIQTLAPDESVLFHAYWSWREIMARVLLFAAVLVALMAWIAVFVGDGGWIGEALVPFVLGAAVLIRQLRHAEALVTERRLLHGTGRKGAPPVEIAIADIAEIDISPGFLGFRGLLRIRMLGGGQVRVRAVPGLRQLWRVLASQAGLPAPPTFGFKMKLAYYGPQLLCILAGFGFAAEAAHFLFEGVDGDGPAATIAFMILFLIYIPVMLGGLALGALLAWLVSAVLIRMFLTASQARQIVSMAYGAKASDSKGLLARKLTGAALRFFGWLYGQPMGRGDES